MTVGHRRWLLRKGRMMAYCGPLLLLIMSLALIGEPYALGMLIGAGIAGGSVVHIDWAYDRFVHHMEDE